MTREVYAIDDYAAINQKLRELESKALDSPAKKYAIFYDGRWIHVIGVRAWAYAITNAWPVTLYATREEARQVIAAEEERIRAKSEVREYP